MAMNKIKVAIIVGSDSDLPVVEETAKILGEFNIPFTVNIASAHRTPVKVKECIRNAEQRGASVFIAAAGMAAALPGVVASETTLPVIGIPVEGKSLMGMDSLFSIVQMPPGIPVATVAIGKAGATNAGILAVEILAISERRLRQKLANYRRELARKVAERDTRLQQIGLEKYVAMKKK